MYQKGFTNLDALDANQAMLDKARAKRVYTNFICDYMGPNKLAVENGEYTPSFMQIRLESISNFQIY